MNVDASPQGPSSSDDRSASPELQLRADLPKSPSILVQSITHIAPAVGLVLSLKYIVLQAGAATPLAFGIAFLVAG